MKFTVYNKSRRDDKTLGDLFVKLEDYLNQHFAEQPFKAHLGEFDGELTYTYSPDGEHFAVNNYETIYRTLDDDTRGCVVFYDHPKGQGSSQTVEYKGKIFVFVWTHRKTKKTIYRTLNHEWHHVMHIDAHFKGYNLGDEPGVEIGYVPMDRMLVDGEWIKYYKNRDIDAPDGNRADSWRRLKKSGYTNHFNRGAIAKTLISLLFQLINLLRRKLQGMRDRLFIARTLYGEARGESLEGQRAVVCVIKNRMESERFPDTGEAVCLQPYQFSVWNKVGGRRDMLMRLEREDLVRELEIVSDVMDEYIEDITHGATHYYANKGANAIDPPSWAEGATKTAQIGNHVFYKDVA